MKNPAEINHYVWKRGWIYGRLVKPILVLAIMGRKNKPSVHEMINQREWQRKMDEFWNGERKGRQMPVFDKMQYKRVIVETKKSTQGTIPAQAT